jgi:transposase-like protein
MGGEGVTRMAKRKTTASSKSKSGGELSIAELAKKIGVTRSTIRARRARGMDVTAPRQIRLTDKQMQQVAKARGTTTEVARKFGCSVSTVKRLRRVYGTSGN